jgi:D-serine deaminase-like pyridoxal phosphate-dependent protein
MDHSIQHHRSYIGRPASNLPSPSLIISKPIVEENIKRLYQDVANHGIGFRPHTKTLKVSIITALGSPQHLLIRHHRVWK